MNKPEQRFTIKSISISRGYSETDPFKASVGIKSSWDTDMTIKLPEERVLAIIDVVSDIIADALSGHLDNMREDHLLCLDC